jgi:hypothetical protein
VHVHVVHVHVHVHVWHVHVMSMCNVHTAVICICVHSTPCAVGSARCFHSFALSLCAARAMVDPRGGGSERSQGSLERSLSMTSAAAEALIAETIRAEEEDMKVLYDEQAYKELSKDEVVDRKMKVSSAPSGRLDALKRQHSMQFDKTMDLNRAQKLWMLLDDPSFSSTSFYYANFSMLIILISTISFCLESEFNCMNVDLHPHLLNYTLPNGQLACDEWEKTWFWFECLAVVFFTAELTVRFIVCPSKGKFMKDFANWIDLLAILPFYLEQVCTRAFCTPHSARRARLHLCTLRAPAPSTLAILRLHPEQVAGDVLSAFSVFRVIRLVRSAPWHVHPGTPLHLLRTLVVPMPRA